MPTLRASSSASSLRFAAIASASACRRRERSVAGVLPQSPSSAARAASTARSTSASPASCAVPSGSPDAGSRSSRLAGALDGLAVDEEPVLASRRDRHGGTIATRVRRHELLGAQPTEALASLPRRSRCACDAERDATRAADGQDTRVGSCADASARELIALGHASRPSTARPDAARVRGAEMELADVRELDSARSLPASSCSRATSSALPSRRSWSAVLAACARHVDTGRPGRCSSGCRLE